VGAGDGLIAFGALEAVGETGTVIFSDVSEELIAVSRRIAEETGVSERCRFVVAPAEDLGPIPAESVDAVFTRSVLIYVKDKQRAFAEFHRVLRSGGRLSSFEPINRFTLDRRPASWFVGYDVTPVQDLAAKVLAAYRASGPPLEENPMFDFDERDLFDVAVQAGFAEIRLDFHADIAPDEPASVARTWESFAASSGNPLEPTVGEMIDAALTPDEAARFVAHLRPLVEEGRQHTTLRADAYLVARK
jgi:ubiquinone/menaquinone biosynthesis C-methylase UbiE